MGYKVQFDDGHEIEFDKEPSQADIEEAHTQLTKASGDSQLQAQLGKLADYAKAGIGELSGGLKDILGMATATTNQPTSQSGQQIQGGAEQAAKVGSSFAAPFTAIAPAAMKVASDAYTGNNDGPDAEGRTGPARAYSDAMDAVTYSPKSEKGQEYNTPVDEAINRYLIPLIGHGSAMEPPAMPAKGIKKFAETAKAKELAKTADAKLAALEALSEKPREEVPAPEAAQEVAAAPGRNLSDPFGQMKQQLGVDQSLPPEPNPVIDKMVKGLQDEPAKTPQIDAADAAQRAITDRQAALEQEVKQRGTLDFNAAERARQEAAPLPPKVDPIEEHPFVKAADDKVAKQQEVVQKLTQQMEEGKAQASQIARAVADLENFKTAAERTRNNVQKGLSEGQKPAPFDFKRQGGGVNLAVFDEGFRKVKEFGDYTLELLGRQWGPEVRIYDKSGQDVGGLSTSAVYGKGRDQNLSADFVKVMSEHQKKGLAEQAYKFLAETGNDIQKSSTQLKPGREMWKRFEEKGLAKNGVIPAIPNRNIRSPGGKQQGGINVKAFKEAGDKAMAGLNDTIKRLTNVAFDPKQRYTDYIQKNIPGFSDVLKDKFAVPDAPEKTIQEVLKGKDTPPIWKWGQSGPDLTAAKFNENPLLIATSRQLNYSYKSSELQIRQLVKPLQKYLSTLSTKEFTELQNVFKTEMFKEKRFSEDQLRQAGYSDNQINAYKMQRAAYDEMLELQNKGRELSGRDKITEGDAYYASRWTGDWHTPVLDKDGKLAWYIRTNTKAEAAKAIDYLKTTFGDKLKIDDKTVPEYRANRHNPSTPKDIIGAYHDMLDFFSDTPEVSKQIKDALEDYLKERAYTVNGQNKHFLEKGNIRGAIGDRPWLSDTENAYAGQQAQMDYMTSGIRWANTQNAIGNLKQVLSDPQVIAKMPNAVAYAKSVMAKAVGVDSNLFSSIETSLAKIFPNSLSPLKLFDKNNYGVSKGSLYRATGDLKTLTYLQMLGFSPAYMIATPLQAVMAVPMWHRILTTEGFSHNMGKTSLMALADTLAGITNHASKNMGVDHAVPMTELGKAALKYAEDASIISKNIFDESSGLNQHAALANMHAALSWTIGFPEKVARLGAFTSFVHHLEASGKYTNQLEMFRRAEELTDRSMTSFKTFDRPQVVENFGATGHMAYTFKSFLFNAFNNLSVASRMATEGRGTPLAVMVAMYSLMGGLYNAPLVNEMDALWNATKDAVANFLPQKYTALSKVDNGLGIRGNLVSLLPQTSGLRDLIGYGVPSAATGLQLASRMNMATGIDPEHPMNNVAPVLQEMKEQGKLAQALLHPATKDAWLQAAYINAPQAVRGNMETRLDAFKVGNSPGNQGYLKPTDLLNPTMQAHRRTEFDENVRKWGMTSLAEARDKDVQYISSKEQARIKMALGGLTERLMSGIKNQDVGKISDSAIEYLKLNPDTQALDSAIQKGIMQMNATPQEQRAMYLRTIQQINQYTRTQRMQK